MENFFAFLFLVAVAVMIYGIVCMFRSGRRLRGFTTASLGLLFGVISLLQIGSDIDVSSAEGTPEATQAEAVPEEPAEEEEVEQAAATGDEDEAEDCRQDISCHGEKFVTEASVRCTGLIEGLANYDYEWTNGWLSPKFSRLQWVDREAGIVSYIGDEIKFQNGFGAWQYHTYRCNFDTELEAVVDVEAYPGRI
ncbi:hypothetical protein [Pararhizobium haloflavum]|uniref:hypothetical protein n=1 Tax=Pararhizobium haloflavum TaxID=2037914 RepID=UPI0012FFFED1|nr:hypothetical protein [Pararhizobium haloflavum]